ncbi:hypothetical protein Tco_0747023 [Tanacetum coccineum]
MVVAERYRLQLSMGSRSGRELYFKLSPIVKASLLLIIAGNDKGLPIILNDYIRGHVKGGFQPERLARARISRIFLDGYGGLVFIPLWYLVSVGTDTSYLP